MRLLLLAPAALLLVSASEPPQPSAPAEAMPVIDPTPQTAADCPPISRYHAMRRGGGLSPEKLGELPGADHYKAVYRRIGDCVAPVIADFGVGAR